VSEREDKAPESPREPFRRERRRPEPELEAGPDDVPTEPNHVRRIVVAVVITFGLVGLWAGRKLGQEPRRPKRRGPQSFVEFLLEKHREFEPEPKREEVNARTLFHRFIDNIFGD
jgi:hypothetical protein